MMLVEVTNGSMGLKNGPETDKIIEKYHHYRIRQI